MHKFLDTKTQANASMNNILGRAVPFIIHQLTLVLDFIDFPPLSLVSFFFACIFVFFVSPRLASVFAYKPSVAPGFG